MRTRIHALALLAVLALTGAQAQADFNPISQPTLAYTSSTTLIDISSIPDLTSGITSVTNGVQTLNFDQAMTKASVPSGGWATWGSPPDTESYTPSGSVPDQLEHAADSDERGFVHLRLRAAGQ